MESSTPDQSKTAGDPDPGVIVDSALAHAQTRLLAQIAEDVGLDERTTGLLALNGVLITVVIAGRRELFGEYWPGPIVVILFVTGMLLWVLFGSTRVSQDLTPEAEAEGEPPGGKGKRQASRPPDPGRIRVMDLGSNPLTFYREMALEPSIKARASLLRDLNRSSHWNNERIKWKRRWLSRSIKTLIVGLGIAGILIATHPPTRMTTCVATKSRSCPRRNRPGSNTKARAAQSANTSSGELVRLAQQIESAKRGPLVKLAEEIER